MFRFSLLRKPAVGFLVIALSVVTVVGCSHHGSSSLDATLSASFDLGSIEIGQEAFAVLELTNPGADPLSVAPMETSCECVTVVEAPAAIAPRSKASVRVKIEGIEPGDFDFEVTARLQRSQGDTVVRTSRLHASVYARPVLASKAEAERTGLLVSADSLVAAPQHHRFVDVRDAESFSRGAISGAENWPLNVIKTKPRLKATSLVIVGDGIAEERLLNETRLLRTAGFEKTQVLRGGIRAWKRAGGLTVGRRVADLAMAAVTHWRLREIQREADWQVVAVNPPDDFALHKAFAGLETVRVHATTESDLSAIVEAVLGVLDGSGRKTLVVSTPQVYGAVERALGSNRQPVFYLSDGFKPLMQAVHVVQSRPRGATEPGVMKVNNFDVSQRSAGRVSVARGGGGCSTCPGK